MIVHRHARRACVCVFACALLACKIYNPSLITDRPATDSGPAPTEAGPQPDACTHGLEICNGVDDDCDGTSDESAAVMVDCATRVLHASSRCQEGLCVYLRECEVGYFNCDGQPENGCESNCPCTGCVEGGGDDAGADAGE
jgi:hypothetical protein